MDLIVTTLLLAISKRWPSASARLLQIILSIKIKAKYFTKHEEEKFKLNIVKKVVGFILAKSFAIDNVKVETF
nr:hypothetical protein [Ningiella sp. W23]